MYLKVWVGGLRLEKDATYGRCPYSQNWDGAYILN